MSAQVGSQVEVKREALVAYVALVWLLTCVDQLVSSEFGVVKESLAAAFDLAYEHPLSMCHLMLPKASLISEYLHAIINWTDELLLVQTVEKKVKA